MHSRSLRPWLAVLGGLVLGLPSAPAQDSKALIRALAANGVITSEQATKILADLEQNAASTSASAASATSTPPEAPAKFVTTTAANANGANGKLKFLESLSVYGLLQQQFYTGATEVDGAADNPHYATNRFFVRRAQIGLRASLGGGFGGVLNYDFAGSYFEQAVITWKHGDSLLVEVGHRKAPFGYDEVNSSREMKAIERSPVTNYFTGSNNNRRLGGGSYRQGVFVSGKTGSGFFYTAAITNPDRAEYGDPITGPSATTQRVSATTNTLAYWGRAGFDGKLGRVSYKLGADAGWLPEQGGNTVPKATGDLTVYGVFADVTLGRVNLAGQYYRADVEGGRPTGADASPSGFWIQPSVKLGEKWEAVVRYTYLDSDGRGVDLSDGVRSAPGGGTMDRMSEWFVGGSWFLRGHQAKLQAGYLYAEAKDALSGEPAGAHSDGFRSQLQLFF